MSAVATFSPETEAFILRLLHILGIVGQALRARLPAPSDAAQGQKDARTQEIELLCQALEALTARVRATRAAPAAAEYADWPGDEASYPAGSPALPAETPATKQGEISSPQASRFKRQLAPPDPISRSRKNALSRRLPNTS